MIERPHIMALIDCPECGHQVSDAAETCPSCGVRLNDQTIQLRLQLELSQIELEWERERKRHLMHTKIYLNGAEIFRYPRGRVLVRDQDQVANISLRQGTNVLVFKVVNQTGGWQGCIRFTDKAGQPAEGLQYRVSP